MGVEGAVGFLAKSGQRYVSAKVELTAAGLEYHGSSAMLVIDTTKALDKLVRKKLPMCGHTEAATFGSSMLALGNFYRQLIRRLKRHNVEPIFVLNGGRKSERLYGPSASCARHFRYSCSAALERGRYLDLPELSMNVLKEMIDEEGVKYVYQAAYEVYPTLEHVARRYNCPVLTGHSDFIFSAAPVGFFWFDNFNFEPDESAAVPLSGLLYSHSSLLASNNLRAAHHSSALKTFSVLLRPDFHENHYETLNQLFQLRGEMRLSWNVRDRRLTQRLTQIVHNMHTNPNLDSFDSVRKFLVAVAGADSNLVKDFDAIHDTYANHYEDLAATEFFRLLASPAAPSRVEPNELLIALTRRLTTAEVVFQLGNTHFHRPLVEDKRLFRSVFSLQDRVRQFLLENAMAGSGFDELRLLDRQAGAMVERTLRRRPSKKLACRLDALILLRLFHIEPGQLDLVSTRLNERLANDLASVRPLALLLLLARFVFRLAFRLDYENEPRRLELAALSNITSAPTSVGNIDLARAQEYADTRDKFYIALLNSFMYLTNDQKGTINQSELPAEIRVARNAIKGNPELEWAKMPSISPTNRAAEYIKFKHTLEMFNSVLHIYQEINALYNFPAPIVLASRHYDGVLMYKLMACLSRRFESLLLKMDDELLRRELDLAPILRGSQTD